MGINVVANGFDWEAGDNIILSNQEHPGNLIPWYNIARRHGVELRFVHANEDYSQFLEEFGSLLDERTRVVSISHISRYTGLRFPVREMADLAHRRDIPLLMDGAQAFGSIPVDVKDLDCDFYAFQWTHVHHGATGHGGLYVRKDRVDWLKPSWIGSHSEREFDMQGNFELWDEARRFEFGTRESGGSSRPHKGPRDVGEHRLVSDLQLYKRVLSRLKAALQTVSGMVLDTPREFEKSSGIVTFQIPGQEAATLCSGLLEVEKILVSPVDYTSERIRVSTHVFNTDEEIERLVAGLNRICHQSD